MLFLLKNVSNGDVFYLSHKNQFVVGRKDCDFLIQNDQSISRKHAVIRLKENKVTVEDCGSKYNTFYKGEKLNPQTEIELAVGDNIQFGVSSSIYSLQKYEFITTGTRLNTCIKTKLLSDLSALNGKYVDQWTSECTHLTVEEVTLTIKFLHALIDEKPVIKPTYWTKFAERVQKNLPPPNIELYNKPPVAEMLLNKIDLKSNPNRKSLYKGKVFIFPMEKDKKQLEDVIKKAGGTSISWDKNPIPLEDIENSPKEFLIIQTADVINNPHLNKVIKKFSKQGKRTIPLQEIATSIVLCSCERDCNPSFNRVEQVFPLSRPREPTQNNALAANTESQYFTVRELKSEEKGRLVIPDTFENDLNESEPSNSNIVAEKGESNSQSMKRLNNDKLQETSVKKAKLDSESNIKQESKDRFLSKNISSKKRVIEETESEKQNENRDETSVNPFAFLNRNKTIKTEPNSSLGNNPFKVMKKESGNASQVSRENPFSLSLGNKKRGNDDLPEPSTSKKKKGEVLKDKIFSSTKIENISDNSTSVPRISRISKDLMNNTWISKDAKNITTNSTDNITTYFDIEIKQFIDQFKNTMIVEVMEKIPLKPKISKDHIGKFSKEGKVNFKIFKKVMPLNPQNRIITKINLTAVGPANTTGIVDNRREIHNSDDEVEENLKIRKKQTKKFRI